MDTEDIEQISFGKRLGTMLLDHSLMTMIGAMIAVLGGLIYGVYVAIEQTSIDYTSKSWNYLFALVFSVYLCKDSINGRSPAKRILKLQVVDHSTGKVAGPLKCLIRNLSLIIWPLEGIIALIDHNRRLGDRLAGTSLVIFSNETERSKTTVLQILLSFAVAYILMALLLSPLDSLIADN